MEDAQCSLFSPHRVFLPGGFVDDLSLINRSQPMHPMAEATTYHHPYSPLTVRRGTAAAPRQYESYNGNGSMWAKPKA